MSSNASTAISSRRSTEIWYISLFLSLQVLDAVTTMIGFRMGLSEASPFVRWLTHFSPALGLAICKLVAVLLLLICVALQRPRVIRLSTYWYTALVAWNLFMLAFYGRR
jgi:Domain of unknown function (DUF5658)